VSFRGRLRLFFALIVILPMIALALVLFTLSERSETGKVDAAVSTGVEVAFEVHDEETQQAGLAAQRVATDPAVRAVLTGAAGGGLDALVNGDVVAVEVRSPDGEVLERAGSDTAVAARATAVDDEAGRELGLLTVSVTEAGELAERVRALSGEDVSLFRDGSNLAHTLPDGVAAVSRSSLGAVGEPVSFEEDGRSYRGRVELIDPAVGPTLEIAVFEPAAQLEDTVNRNRFLIAVLLLVFLVAALVAATLVSRSLTGQIGAFLDAARRLARGDFREPVPVHGNDEFAQLGREFNSMSVQLETNIQEVERKRGELEDTIRRVGEALATALDRQGVVDLAVRQAVDACEADACRARPLDPQIFTPCQAGSSSPDLEEAIEAAERAAFAISPEIGPELIEALEADAEPRAARRHRAVASEASGSHALTVAMRAISAGPEFLGALSIARRGRPFSQSEQELLEYLAGQAVVSIENATLHETVERQAVTDSLTGLANARAFFSTLDAELERNRRFGDPVGLVIADLDDFKNVNDTHGHQQGDEVLAQVAAVLREASRDIDTVARYGGEELAVVLPQTDAAGAALLAERMREAIERLEVPRVTGRGGLRVTASLGVASLPASASDRDGLVAAADAALYRAKRAGKNRVEVAQPAQASGSAV
jgi:diguanylate cyclase (GGDEF)-like protein